MFSHPKCVEEIQDQKREAFNQFLDNLMGNSLKGVVFGLTLSQVFFFGRKRVPFQLMGLFSGFGAGASINVLATEFNRI